MVKKFKKENKKSQKLSSKRKDKKERKSKNKKKEDNNEENKADFYLDDADADIAYDSSELEAESKEGSGEDNSIVGDMTEEEEMSEHGSELDFKEEDYIPSEEDGEEEKETKKKDKKMSKKELKKLISKLDKGSDIYISKFLILVGKLTNPNNEMNFEDDGEENVLTNSKVINNILKYFITELPNILQLKINSKEEEQNKSNNNLIKKYLSILVRYIKTCEKEMSNFIFYNIEKISPLIFQFNNFTEIVLKLSIKLWSSTADEELRKILLSFIKSLITKKPKFFEYSIKIFYINYLNIAKEMNLNTFIHIKQLQDDIINILNYDLQKAYTTIFTFIRKLCIQLRGTIVDKTISSIKSIYNWQFVNSLILWGRVIMKYISDSNIYLLIYPLIQTIIGVIRLNYNEQYYLLRIRLVILLNGISRVSNIFIPTPMYILPILSSNYFIEKCRPIVESSRKKKKDENDKDKDNKIYKPKINSRIVINVSLKIKKEEFKIKQIRKDLLEECCDCLLEYLSINSNKICFVELADNILKEMKSALKRIYDKEYREIIKLRIEKIENNIREFHENLSNKYDKSIILIKPNTIENFEKQNINDFSKEWMNIRHRRQATFEAIKSQKQNKFIEV